ncbi:MAG TPA: hypothetical protein VMW50_03535 [Dehalococcoidia bacterium]|nr:hypothetical protein [Dehalococcoidia bacterium]
MSLRICNNCTRVECKGIASIGPCGKYKAPKLPTTTLLHHIVSKPNGLGTLYILLAAYKMEIGETPRYPGFSLILH